MDVKDVKKVGVLGAGTMGSGIAQVFAQAGYQVAMKDIEQRFLDKGMATIKKNLSRSVEKGRISQEDMDKTLANIKPTLNMEDLKDAQLIVEAVIENIDLKKKVFKELDDLCPEDTVFASNTSSISITEMAAVTRRANKFVGMHFMNPVPVMKLVEVVKGHATDKDVVDFTVEMSKVLGKVPVVVNDYPGFISNRLLMPMINEACYALMEGVADKEAIDTVMKLGMNHPMGPLTLADLIGLDVCLYIMEVLYEGFGDPKYRPCPLLRKMVAAGYLGRKSGRGFYQY